MKFNCNEPVGNKEKKCQTVLTSAHSPTASLRGGVPALAVGAAVGRPRVGAVAEATVHALGGAGRPRRPLRPTARGGWKKEKFGHLSRM